ncbi:hypothetical protein [Mycoplasma bradburyae]|uniref:GNAT family N-acetyltransferase n=1 Tax=Mycoplasma bradburyae TaxID=2963128 RepID=A0ABT5GAG7_9MOLU|nr:hypothetical protein [Mycoplasma bradburyae]MDC4181962.1 hypothetical protein [Mycoplasma bradburyae]MDC4182665.1 hypothetical protein [Mycoplasma bradburyae]MDC4184145.1 hypothetical protein [Mycoplasma bradburyae]UTS70387.1 hypothetical protein NMG68_01445 [Mycoplasma bradburyae]
MLELTKDKKLIEQYKYFYLRAFKEENEFSWNYLINAYYGKEIKIYVEKDIKKDFKYGCFVLDKKLVINNETKTAALVFGVVSDERFRGKGVLNLSFEPFLNELAQKYDLVLIQSFNWKIYRNFELDPLDNLHKFALLNQFKKNDYLNKIDLFNYHLNQEKIIDLYEIRKQYLIKNKIDNYSDYSLEEYKKYLLFNFLIGDVIYYDDTSYCQLSKDFEVYQLFYLDKNAINDFILRIPTILTLSLNDYQINDFKHNQAFIKTNQINLTRKYNKSKLKINAIFFNELN